MNKAITLLTQPQAQLDPLVFLLSSMVFAGCDCMQRNPRRGLLHLKSGLKMLEELYPSMSGPDQTLARELLQPLIDTYVRGLLPWETGGLSEMKGTAESGIKLTDELMFLDGCVSTIGAHIRAIEH